MYLVASSGGHTELLHMVRGAFVDHPLVWILQPSQRAEELAAAGAKVNVLPDYDRNVLRGNHLSNIFLAARLVWRYRPSLVVTSGAGITVPFCFFARLMGAKVIFAETMARITGPSASGRVLSRLASTVLVQWPEALDYYPHSILCEPALLSGIDTSGTAKPGRGTFVGVGTHRQQFDRLLAMVDRAVEDGVLPTPVIAQGGSSGYNPTNYEIRDWLTPAEIDKAISGAEFVVCHAGSGLVSTALRAGRRPMVLPRRAQHDEHFDDHQTQIAARFAELGLIVPLDGDRITEENLRAAKAPLTDIRAENNRPPMEDVLRDEL